MSRRSNAPMPPASLAAGPSFITAVGSVRSIVRSPRRHRNRRRTKRLRRSFLHVAARREDEKRVVEVEPPTGARDLSRGSREAVSPARARANGSRPVRPSDGPSGGPTRDPEETSFSDPRVDKEPMSPPRRQRRRARVPRPHCDNRQPLHQSSGPLPERIGAIQPRDDHVCVEDDLTATERRRSLARCRLRALACGAPRQLTTTRRSAFGLRAPRSRALRPWRPKARESDRTASPDVPAACDT